MIKVLVFLDKRSRLFLIIMGILSILILGAIDYLTGAELSFSIFYLLPISLVAWVVGRAAGIGFSAIGAIVWFMADSLAGHEYSYSATPYWNAIVRMGFFVITTQILAGLRASWERQEELGQFIVHDLRSPLSNIMTGLYIIKETAGEQLDATQNDLVEMSIISGNRMLTLINSLLDLARLEGGGIPLNLENINVRELVESSLDQVSVWARRNDVKLVTSLDGDSLMVYADFALTSRILVNLLSNAIKFSPAGSTVKIHVTSSNVTALTFSVIDQGRGISPEWTDKVFDKYVQVDARRTGKTIGSGLGLAFCRLAIGAQGGRIWLNSQMDKGTTISFTLPVNTKSNSVQGGEMVYDMNLD
ncbi:MAG: hypothetical protein JXA42_21365 [Anaerolineales bacterium]|nr:hypothetical protein [Anaerolineales bacterium]